MRFGRVSLFAQALLYMAGGVNHFWHPAFYLHIMPDHYRHPGALVRLTGVTELLGGIGLLVPAAKRIAAAGICLMLVVFFDVHFYMLRHPERFPDVPAWILWARIPLQFLLITWAWLYTKSSRTSSVKRR